MNFCSCCDARATYRRDLCAACNQYLRRNGRLPSERVLVRRMALEDERRLGMRVPVTIRA